MGFYLLSELGLNPVSMSLYAAISISSSVLLNTFFGRLLDRSARGRYLLVLASIAYSCGCLSLLVWPEYSTVLVAGTLWFPIAATATSTAFALAFLEGPQDADSRLSMGSRLKAANSIGWMIGPAAAFGVNGSFGSAAVFTVLFYAGVAWGILTLAATSLGAHPSMRIRETKKLDEPLQTRPPSNALLAGLVVCALFSAAHALCSVALPLYITKELSLPSYVPGAAFSVKVFAELIVIILTPAAIRAFGIEATLFTAGATSIAAFSVFLTAGSVPTVLAGAAIEGCFYGLFSAASLPYVQRLSDGRHGKNTARYMNSIVIGSLIASPAVGLVAQWSSFSFAIALAAAVVTCAIAILAIESRSPRPMGMIGTKFPSAMHAESRLSEAQKEE
jgi:SET family sugar efflux transporter-like MFS transporter